MQQMDMVADLPMITNVNAVSEGCVLGKHARQSFEKKGSWRAYQPLELDHTDLCGPMQSESNGGNGEFIPSQFMFKDINDEAQIERTQLNTSESCMSEIEENRGNNEDSSSSSEVATLTLVKLKTLEDIYIQGVT